MFLILFKVHLPIAKNIKIHESKILSSSAQLFKAGDDFHSLSAHIPNERYFHDFPNDF